MVLIGGCRRVWRSDCYRIGIFFESLWRRVMVCECEACGGGYLKSKMVAGAAAPMAGFQHSSEVAGLTPLARAVLDAAKDFSETCHASPPGSRLWVESAYRLDDTWNAYASSLERDCLADRHTSSPEVTGVEPGAKPEQDASLAQAEPSLERGGGDVLRDSRTKPFGKDGPECGTGDEACIHDFISGDAVPFHWCRKCGLVDYSIKDQRKLSAARDALVEAVDDIFEWLSLDETREWLLTSSDDIFTKWRSYRAARGEKGKENKQ